MRSRSLRIALLTLAGLAALAAILLLLREPRETPDIPRYNPVSFSDLPGWREDDHSAALAAFLASCRARLAQPANQALPPRALEARAGDWFAVCRRALALGDAAAGEARKFFENAFTPLEVRAGTQAEGVFTGYYEPEIAASETPDPDYPIPIYRRPDDLVAVDLGAFRPDLEGRRIAGRVEGGRLVPYASRTEIAAGALEDRSLELLWAADPVAVFMLQIQGSGRARLPDGRMLRLGYAGHNGHPYTSLGRLMVARGLLASESVSAPAIADWLRAHPERGAALMAENAAYVFFRILEGKAGPIGAEGVALTPGRSLAVDASALPFGAPVWLATRAPDPAAPESRSQPLRRLMVAQDTGSAITGAVRGDVFWGAGEKAARIAGHMAHRGRYWLLLPRPLAERLREQGEPLS